MLSSFLSVPVYLKALKDDIKLTFHINEIILTSDPTIFVVMTIMRDLDYLQLLADSKSFWSVLGGTNLLDISLASKI